MIRLVEWTQSFVAPEEIELQQPFVETAHRLLEQRSGAGHEFLGWMDLPSSFDPIELQRIKEAGQNIAKQANLLVVIGIGGSYLGARAALHMLQHSFHDLLPREQRPLQVVFAGHQMSATYLAELLELLDHYEVAVNVISKSGTTTEPALAFRTLKQYMEQRYGIQGAAQRIYATTDAKRGALRKLANEAGYETFVIPDDVGGRFSVLTPVGLLPLAAAGIDVDALLQGAKRAQSELRESDVRKNPAYTYAALRQILRAKGKAIELFVTYEPALHYVGEWWKQLFGESEGKDGKGLYPASADFSTDLHSLGQFVQDGARTLFETVIKVKNPRRSLQIEEVADDLDGLNYLAGRPLQQVNDTALEATMLAHQTGGVPTILLELDDMSAASLGYLFYFFEKAVAVSAYLQGVNPFDQPGVEMYKSNMFALLGKPGYENQRERLATMAKVRES
ncbi:glucose-6-phosphate isomerase [Sulfoacidibacillus thermotolerans]|uniref:Glucose-6-phosphate isomerase n=1 Tax=Sulfoacidibacillus thermotolerans TaxID=1765684 RepID=A0A2U3DBU2_SULT2|nr:glucose-6-phosphate isomerase [Sulfoacidibacillus thermotolerans]PWI58746.1 glucose-6-phosphate isomerase [Sulfoacidibacillus thermotolerans]